MFSEGLRVLYHPVQAKICISILIIIINYFICNGDVGTAIQQNLVHSAMAIR